MAPHGEPDQTRAALPLWALMAVPLLVAFSIADIDILAAHTPLIRSRAPLALLINLSFAAAAFALRGVSLSGAVAGAVVGFVLLTASGWAGWFMLSATFVVALGSTRFGSRHKAAMAIGEERGGRRAAANVIANTGVAAVAAACSVASAYPVECTVLMSAAMITGASDTAASEIGKAVGGRTRSVISWTVVRPGTTGAVSIAGTLAGAGAAWILATVAWAGGLLRGGWETTAVASAAVAALLLEGVVSTVCEERRWLDNDGVNLVSSLMGAALALGALAFSGVRAVP